MKKQNLSKGCFRNTLLSLIILISVSISLVAQTNSPVKLYSGKSVQSVSKLIINY